MNAGYTIVSECHTCCLVQNECSFVAVTGQDGGMYWELVCAQCRTDMGLGYEPPVILMVNQELEEKT